MYVFTISKYYLFFLMQAICKQMMILSNGKSLPQFIPLIIIIPAMQPVQPISRFFLIYAHNFTFVFQVCKS